ncbi:DUF5368 domain-containing protein [Rhodospirillum rubrum]|uniref:Uncharacterized protein n=1 Tax=Rhodospirillum rubrum (strain ATCC 11170 / ATH 1.1.1 / DSM 467 / LMG 4362 / NCIMB 8255 / S1) TaxID=269796 RepID=Q2RRY9_RHORT|nr:DUF5368 domain-containing protein [Rhodospirillum rubrum]ABC23106.1 conserved hypothetical protein [Rhodospirillum rubrum ATCC 11170]AEO48836.1 hypothetical protein F11_11860 [Rhodospirillum rubrum F11]MBK5954769.1 hypothetical protein [Rhodospirillum rubrum]QXG79090.1 DUF5368 domain-containing protein [Rhodospirillum rubrum]HAP98678.1 hypothetical protein [Rhodospirillum rubrum]
MEKFDPIVFFQVFQEMLGPVLWILLALALLGLGGALFVFLKEGKINSRRLVRSELIGLAGGVLALVLAARVTVSGFSDAGGPVDWLLVGLIWGIGLAGSTILAYATLGLVSLRRSA